MNALVALLHFCEVHGPRVVFCTQTSHGNVDIDDATTTTTQPTFQGTAPVPIPSTHEPSIDPYASSVSRVASLRKGTPSTAVTTLSSCAACTAQMPLVLNTKHGPAVEAKSMVVSDDEDPTVQYVGMASPPQHLHLYKAVRLACIRSLTTEFCPGREGPVLFGDDDNGYALSYLFKLRDAHARGETRFYALMVLMTDRVFLVSCWPFFVSAFRSMAINLQNRANAVFQSEKELRQWSHPRRAMPSMSQDQFFRRRSHTALRSLVDLLGTRDIYAQIHAQFSYILKLSARRRMEKLSGGRNASVAYLAMRDEYRKKRRQVEGRGKEPRHPAGVASSPPLVSTPYSPCT